MHYRHNNLPSHGEPTVLPPVAEAITEFVTGREAAAQVSAVGLQLGNEPRAYSLWQNDAHNSISFIIVSALPLDFLYTTS